MAEPAIVVRGVGKRYRVYRRQSDRLAEWITPPPAHRPFWALRDVSFDVRAGRSWAWSGATGPASPPSCAC